MLKEFRDFALKGNVVDLAVAVVIGGAFGKIVASFVNDVLMPLLGLVMGGVNFTDLKYVFRAAQGDIPELALRYGAFIQSIVDFIIIAFSIFMFIKMLSRMKKKQEEAPAAPPAPSNEEVLLGEIRDLLKAEK
ncbi:large-conductance mechanosensitive channel [Peptoclostridium acidaminophilum DSM 3953]|uniref:Large-conductance mechanosensitive channel n=1 Tax=Peptoclostridium acidaminophilum DSM 3953 TaxID=1286171 RepID=W8U995_PEPAC|nr:large-conductance mechanosensitive channel protein MscL [Peptoclostridium acidaminophilum]AHM57436.1 large-conductance mechanosensitive channel [Peptoclostridium acidaminophilum DSM 3953]